jgi:predicted lipid-binding transport protein (Tim44 family)
MADSQLLGILLIAMVAGIILFRLYTVLGRRTGNEREPQERLRRIGGALPQPVDKVAALPDRTGPTPTQAQGDGVERGLVDIKLADRTFETEHFLEGARAAYKLILDAFAARDRATLRRLLSDEVYSAFDAVMRGREERNETVKYALVGFKNVRIVHAEMKGRTAEITVEFAAQSASSTLDAKGTVIDGDAGITQDVTDVWTFAREIRASDPNWTLVATSSAG